MQSLYFLVLQNCQKESYQGKLYFLLLQLVSVDINLSSKSEIKTHTDENTLELPSSC